MGFQVLATAADVDSCSDDSTSLVRCACTHRVQTSTRNPSRCLSFLVPVRSGHAPHVSAWLCKSGPVWHTLASAAIASLRWAVSCVLHHRRPLHHRSLSMMWLKFRTPKPIESPQALESVGASVRTASEKPRYSYRCGTASVKCLMVFRSTTFTFAARSAQCLAMPKPIFTSLRIRDWLLSTGRLIS